MNLAEKTISIRALLVGLGIGVTLLIGVCLLRYRSRAAERPVTPPSTPHTDSLERRWRSLKPITLLVGLLMSLPMLVSAQTPFRNLTPDCCLQAVKLQAEVNHWKIMHREADSLYHETYRTGEELIDAKDAQIEQANGRAALSETKQATAENRASKLETENRKWVPRTWAGRQLRYIERGAAIGFGVIVGTLILLRK